MRSPWQVIKSLTSRRKVEEASEPVGEVVSTTSPRKEEVAQDRAPQAGPDAALDSIPAFSVDDNEASAPPNPAEAETSEPAPVIRADHLPFEPVADDASDLDAQPLPAAPVLQAAEPEPIASASAEDPKEDHAHEVQELNDVTATTAIKRSAKRPEAVGNTFLETAIEEDREINELRSRLSAKLLEQNRQLRRMLERYNDN